MFTLRSKYFTKLALVYDYYLRINPNNNLLWTHKMKQLELILKQNGLI